MNIEKGEGKLLLSVNKKKNTARGHPKPTGSGKENNVTKGSRGPNYSVLHIISNKLLTSTTQNEHDENGMRRRAWEIQTKTSENGNDYIITNNKCKRTLKILKCVTICTGDE